MKGAVVLVGLLSSIAVAMPPLAVSTFHRRQSACAPAHIIVARASGEAKGEGSIGRLSKSLKEAVKGADSEAVDYPAALAPYASSEMKGVTAAKAQLTAYVKRCPESRIVLMGYSQVFIDDA